MPRKVFHGVDYDEDYDAYEDYDYKNYDGYEYDYDVEEDIVETKLKAETYRAAVWRCPICTFDNDESMSACDICGVLRNPLVKPPGMTNGNAVGDMQNDFGASVMAKSLFAPLPHQKPKKAETTEAQNDAFVKDRKCVFHRNGNFIGSFPDIPPFKFDVPSPDDLVSSGIHSFKLRSKGNISKENERILLDGGKLADKHDTTSKRLSGSVALASKDRQNDVQKDENLLKIVGQSRGLSASLDNTSLSYIADANQGGQVTPGNKSGKVVPPIKEEDRLSQLNLAIVGHVDSGKSTLSGRLLHLLGQISQKEMHKYQKEAKQQGKGSFAYAWALDESAEERERGITMNVAVAYLNSKRYYIVLLDSPGHRDFVPNMISGATQADAAILVIDATTGSFEVGMDTMGGQTREHAQLIRSFGVDQIIVAINKLDAVGFSKERFDLIKKQVGSFLRSCGFKDSSVMWIPVSAMENQNLVSNPSDSRLSSWYQGPCLLDAIDLLQPPVRDYSKPVLMPICDVIKSQSHGPVSACGKLETGTIQTGLKVLVMPSKEIATVRSLERDSEVCNSARAGDYATVNLHGIDGNRVMAGDVLCHPDFPVSSANQLEIKVLVLDITTPVLIGSQLECHIHHAKEAARVSRILSLLDPKTGKVIKKSPRCLLAKQNAVIEIVLQQAVCVEEYSNCRALGRVCLRMSGRTVALGVVTRVIGGEA